MKGVLLEQSMSVRRQAPVPDTQPGERRDLQSVSATDNAGSTVMRTVALQLKPEVNEALSQLNLSGCDEQRCNAHYRNIGKLRAMATAKDRQQEEQVGQEQAAMAEAMNLATGVANSRNSTDKLAYEFSDISDTSQAGRLIRGLGGTPSDYCVMVEKKGDYAEPNLHFYPSNENDVNPTLTKKPYTQLQHDSFVALVKTYQMPNFEKLADYVDGVRAPSE